MRGADRMFESDEHRSWPPTRSMDTFRWTPKMDETKHLSHLGLKLDQKRTLSQKCSDRWTQNGRDQYFALLQLLREGRAPLLSTARESDNRLRAHRLEVCVRVCVCVCEREIPKGRRRRRWTPCPHRERVCVRERNRERLCV